VIPVGPGNGNLYAYVNNQPTGFIDPSGREIYDVPGPQSNAAPRLGNPGGGGPAAPRADLGPKVGLDDFNQPDIALPSSIDPSPEALELDDGTDLSLDGDAMSEDTELVLELTETGFDIAGVVDPTPCCDAGGAVCAASRGDIKGAAISVIAMAPYIGDLAKLGKLAKKVKMIERVIERMRDSAAFAERARPLLEKIRKAIPDNLDCYPDWISGPLKSLRDKLDEALTPKKRPGTRGSPDHRADVEGPGADQARELARPGEEVRTERPVQGHPGINRRADNQVVDPEGKTRVVVESERRPDGSYHKKRVEELEGAGIEVHTRPLPPKPN